jgi:hypothetical protein
METRTPTPLVPISVTNGCFSMSGMPTMGSTVTRVTLCHARVGKNQDRKGRFGNQCDEKPKE